MFSDTDSSIYEIEAEDIYEDFSTDKKMFDFSNYSAQLKYYDDSNKLVAKKMKEETARVANKDFIGLKPKMHSILVDDRSENKKTKDVNEKNLK